MIKDSNKHRKTFLLISGINFIVGFLFLICVIWSDHPYWSNALFTCIALHFLLAMINRSLKELVKEKEAKKII